MKVTLYRFIAMLLLVIPGLMATYGFLAMKDAWFAQFDQTAADPGILWGKMILGLILFGVGVAFIGGWIFFSRPQAQLCRPQISGKT